MGKELRSYRMAERVMNYTEGKGDYREILQTAKEFCSKNRVHLFTHVGDDYAAKCIASKITGKIFY